MRLVPLLLALTMVHLACSSGSPEPIRPNDTSADASDGGFWHGGDTARPEGCFTDDECDDLNPCTLDTCHYDHTCRHGPLPEKACDDGNPCTTKDQCSDAGECLGGAPKQCDDLVDCTIDGCHAETGCTHLPAPDGTPCDDGLLCTTEDQCLLAICVGTTPLCDDGNDCTADSCEPQSGTCTHIDQSNLPCDDGNGCTNGDQCHDGTCIPGTPVACDDNNPCTVDECIPLPIDQGGGCTHPPDTGKPCDDANPCSTNDTCNDEGTCIGVGGSCDDNDPCTTDLCSPLDGCYHQPANGASCDDNDPCTGTGQCQNGLCQPGPAINCDDGIECTADSCDESGQCTHMADDGACDDGLFCNGPEFCDPEFSCLSDSPPDADDGIDCTADSCLEGAALIQHIPQHFLCDDADPCTDDFCHVEEGCQNGAKVCDDDNPCTQDSCDPQSGQCLFVPLGECCLVDSDCLIDNPCLGGVCHPEDNACSFHPLQCNDYDPCTVDSCTGGCQHDPLAECVNECADDIDCFFAAPDVDLCTVPTCTILDGQGTCSTFPRLCDDHLACTQDLCQPELGCQYIPIPWCQEPCATAADCNSNDACDTPTCIDGFCANTPDLCDDGLACTGGQCNPTSGLCQLFECPACTCPTCDSDIDCDDASLCTQDVCLKPAADGPGQCRHLPVACRDGNPCTTDLCLAKQGCLFTIKSECTGCQSDGQCQDDTDCTEDTCVDATCQHLWVCD